MKKILVVMVSAAALCALGACDANTPKEGKQQAPRHTQKTLKHEKLFADTKKYLAKQAAKTAEVIKTNAAKLKKTVTSEPTAAAKARKQEQKKAQKARNDQPAKSD
jgi:hypothetical protein